MNSSTNDITEKPKYYRWITKEGKTFYIFKMHRGEFKVIYSLIDYSTRELPDKILYRIPFPMPHWYDYRQEEITEEEVFMELL